MVQVRSHRQRAVGRPRETDTGTLLLPLLDPEVEPVARPCEPAGSPGSRIVVGDALGVLQGLPSESIQCCVTSPPYWGLRDYSIDDQIGAEPVLAEYVSNLCQVFEEVRRVLRTDGTLWLNL